MRVARVLTRLNLGGPARQALASDTRLAAQGLELRLYCGRSEPGEGDLFETFRARGLDVVRIPGLGRGPSPLGDPRAALALARELRRFRPDVLHTHASKAGALGRLAARGRPEIARVHTFHGHVLEGYFPGAVSRRLVALERRAARRTDRVLAVSHATADDLLRLGVCEERKLVVVPPGVELDTLLSLEGRSGALRDLVGAGPEAFVVGALGRLAAVKLPGRAVDVFEMLARRHRHLHLAFVGDGSERRSLERRVAALPPDLGERVHLVGARDDVPALLADLDALLLCSRTEGLPVALIEAAAAGLPVVAARVGGVEELVVHERTGFLAEDTDELAFGLARLVEEPGLGPAMGQRGRLRVARRHSAETLAQRLGAVYEAVLEERRCAS